MSNKPSLFQRLGGDAAVNAAVDIFYNKVMADYHLAPFFEGVDMKRQRNKQAQFLSFAFGGPTKWTGPAMFAVHAPLIRDRGMKLLHFNRVITHLLDTLLELKVPQADVEEVGKIALTLEPIFDPKQYDKNAEAAGMPKLAESKANSAGSSLFDRIGGKPAVDAAVEIFYKKVLADPLLAPYFTGVDMARQRAKQAAFISFAFGSKSKYGGLDMVAAHENLIRNKGMGLAHFDAVAGHLVATLKELKVPQNLIDEAATIVMSQREIFNPERYGVKSSSEKPAAKGDTATLFERVGGKAAVDATVEVFYKKVLADPLLAPYFEGVDMARQRAKQASFISFAFGSKSKYGGRDMVAAHQDLIRNAGLGLVHFDAVAGHLVASMKELGVPQNLIDEAAEIVMTTREVFNPAHYGIKGNEAPAAPGTTLFERVGGKAAVDATVEVFYKKVLADPLLAPYFEGVDMARQRAKQASFISFAFGSKSKYGGRDMIAAHEDLIRNAGLGLAHFDAVAGHLVASMKQLGVPQNLIDEAAEIVMTTRDIFNPANYGMKA